MIKLDWFYDPRWCFLTLTKPFNAFVINRAVSINKLIYSIQVASVHTQTINRSSMEVDKQSGIIDFSWIYWFSDRCAELDKAK